MKKVIIVASFLISTSAFATGPAVTSASGSDANSASNSQAQLNMGSGAVQIDARTIMPDTSGQNAQRGQDDITISAINAAAARDVAASNAAAARDVAALNRETTVRNTPSMMGPNLTTSNDTCMGSTSGSVSIPGFGLGAGTTWTDANCVRLKNSRELWNMGMRAAGLALMCTDPANREALELTGFTCPQTQKARDDQAKAAAEQAQADVIRQSVRPVSTNLGEFSAN